MSKRLLPPQVDSQATVDFVACGLVGLRTETSAFLKKGRLPPFTSPPIPPIIPLQDNRNFTDVKFKESFENSTEEISDGEQMINPVTLGMLGMHGLAKTLGTLPIPPYEPILDKREKGNRKPGMVLIMVEGQKAPIPMGRVDDMGSRGSLNGYKTQTKGDNIIIKVRDIGEAANVMNSINQAVWYTSETNQ